MVFNPDNLSSTVLKWDRGIAVVKVLCYSGTAVAQWLRCCATIRKVAVSIPAGVSGFFIDIKILPIALWAWGRLSL